MSSSLSNYGSFHYYKTKKTDPPAGGDNQFVIVTTTPHRAIVVRELDFHDSFITACFGDENKVTPEQKKACLAPLHVKENWSTGELWKGQCSVSHGDTDITVIEITS